MKQTVKQGVTSRSNFDMSQNHLTTMDFGSIQPTFIQEVVPNDTFHVSMRSFARLAPLAVPTFGKISCTSRAFFVPMRSIWRPFEDFIDRSNDPSLQYDFPTFTNKQLVEFFADDNNLSYEVSRGVYDADIVCDFSVPFIDQGGSPSTSFRNFTNRGRWFYKILLSLGYSINFDLDVDGTSGDHVDLTLMSALPLLAFIRICYDYIFPSTYVNGLSLGSLFDHAHGYEVLSALKDIVCAPYPQDYFTAAWKDINRVGDSDNVTISKVTIENNPNRVISSASTTPKIDNVAANGLTAMGLRLLTAISDFVTRNNIAGSRYFEQLKARFGISSPHATPNRSMFITSFEDPVSIQDVTATATTEGSVLGEQGAKGIQSSVSDNHFSVSSSDTYGYIIILSHVAPDTGFYQGRKRHTLHIDRFDFFTPEFESIGLQPIRNDEIFADYKNSPSFFAGFTHGGKPSGVFGFAPRYIEYKKQEDYLTGDFRLDSVNVGMDSYHLFRNIPKPDEFSPLALNSNFLLCAQHEFDRIFQQPTMPIGLFTFESLKNGYYPQFRFLSFDGNPILFSGPSNSGDLIIYTNDGESLLFDFSPHNSPSNLLQDLRDASSTGDITISFTAPVTVDAFVQDGNTLIGSITFSPTTILSFEGLRFRDSTYVVTSNVTPTNSFNPVFKDENLYLPVNIDSFNECFKEYFDHFYSIFRFDVTANRAMMSISESMPIEDGGAPISVDYEGFNFSV